MDQKLLDRILKCERLPSFPAIAARVIEMCGDENVSIRELGQVLSHDTAISTKILRTINSSFYGLRHRVTTVERATTMLGIKAVKMLALGFSLVPQLKGLGGEDFDPTLIWKRSLFAAVGAHTLGREIRFDHHDEAFIAGLLQDLGVIVMLQALRGEYIKVLEPVMEHHPKLVHAERAAFDLDHQEVGKALAEKWILPDLLISVIAKHESPEQAVPEYEALARAVALGSKAADCFLANDEGRETCIRQYFRYARRWFDLSQEDAARYLEAIETGTRELGKLFDIESKAAQSAEELIILANETLSDLMVQTIHHTTMLEAENQQLSSQALYDPLTGTLNRGGLDRHFRDYFDEAARSGSSLAVVFFDVDKFKPINDQFGHAAGDRVLQFIAQTMNECVPAIGRVGRYGGDEFMVVLPGGEGHETAMIAEKVRQRIDQNGVEFGSNRIRVTVSVGVSCCTGPMISRCQPETLVEAADKAMYAAKSAGGNRVYQMPIKDQPQQKAG
ncbi:MAG: hypothetical protein Kow00105_18510 [Phycisphaeraceae bacterium]